MSTTELRLKLSKIDRSTGVNTRVLLLFGAIAAIAGFSFIIFRSVIRPTPEVDIRFFWLAGKLWAQGIDPYSAAFKTIGTRILPPGNETVYWFYPPQWWAFCRLLAVMDLPHAVMMWRLVSGLVVMGGSALLIAAVAQGSAARRLALIGLGCGFSALIEPTANLIAIGQSTWPIYFAMAALVAGVVQRRQWLVALALFLSTFKPQVGAPLLAAMMLVPLYRRSAIIGLGCAGIFALPQLIVFGPLTTLQEFLDNLQQWSTLPSNVPLTSSGPMHLLARLGLSGLDLHYELAAALAVMLGAGWLLRRSPDRPLAPVYLLMASLVLLIPLHIYDFTVIVVPLVLQIATSGRLTWITALSGLAVIRPSRLEQWAQIPQYHLVSGGLVILTVVALLCFVDAVHAVWRDRDGQVGRAGARLSASSAR